LDFRSIEYLLKMCSSSEQETIEPAAQVGGAVEARMV